ncbi:hypothetical protein KM043_018484 [Ampulex compressa]|nr:hypothetical protein KM043_018484 [Ampulex compressa]
MQNWNQWPLTAGAVTTPMPQPPVGYATPGADPMAMMQAYMQYYNQPAPSGYTAEQWASAQQQNWAQWQQWQQQYQQWQSQYGEKYQETMKHMSAQNVSLTTQAPPLPTVQPPPLPKEEVKPPLPPSAMNTYQFTSMPPPHQNNLPLFPAKQPTSNVMQTSVQICPQNPPLPPSQPPLPPETGGKENLSSIKRGSNSVSESSSAKKLKSEDDELTEAEKTFDAQFKQWEEQFNKWKQQNANHPDKSQYKQYEAKWTSWREKLIERREQMRKKREQQKQSTARAEAEKSKGLPGDEKILNILSSTENQGLINNLLGIGKTLGLTGKQNTSIPPPPPPPPPQTTASISTTATLTNQIASQASVSQISGMNLIPPNMTVSTWATPQWQMQYSTGVNMTNFPNFQSMSGVPPPPFGTPPGQMMPPNFAQPPPSLPNAIPNFSQPPPGFVANNIPQLQNLNVKPPILPNMHERPPFVSKDAGMGMNLLGQNDRPSQSSNSSMNAGHLKESMMGSDCFDRDGNRNLPKQHGSQFRPDGYKLNEERNSEAEPFRRDDRKFLEHGNNQFGLQKNNFGPGNERCMPGNDRFGPGTDRFGLGNNQCGPGSDRYSAGNDRFILGNDRFAPDRFSAGNMDRFGLGNDRPGPGGDRFDQNNDRFPPGNDRFGSGNDRFGNERCGRNNLDRFDQKDIGDGRRDNVGNNNRALNRNNQYEPSDELAPELKKLMEKRKAAMDVFKPSFLDSEKSSNIGSLSESFKKIAGESPFASRCGPDFMQRDYNVTKGNVPLSNFSPRGAPNFCGPRPGNYRTFGNDIRPREPDDCKLPTDSEFGFRGPPGLGQQNSNFHMQDKMQPGFRNTPENFGRNVPNSVDVHQRRGNDFEHPESTGPQQVQESPVNEGNSMAERIVNNPNLGKDNVLLQNVQGFSNKDDGPFDAAQPAKLVEEGKEKQENDGSAILGDDQKEIPLLDKTSWMDASYPEDTLSKTKGSSENEEHNPSAKRDDQTHDPACATSSEENKVQSADDDIGNKKSEALPFMGENDPKPEDLNMEPPPELPNLGPVPSECVNDLNTSDSRETSNKLLDPKGTPQKHLPLNPEFCEPRGIFDAPFGPRGMPFRPNSPFSFGPRGLNDARFPMFGPRPPFTFNNTVGGPSRPQLPTDRQMMFSGPPDVQLGPRPPGDGQFNSREHINGQFGSRNFNDRQFRQRVPGDGQFGPRMPNRNFAPCRSNDASFDGRSLDDTQFGGRGPGEGAFGYAPPGDRFFGARRGNDGPPNQRSLNEPGCGAKNPNDIQSANRNLKDSPFGPRGFEDRKFEPMGSSEGYCESQGTNEKHFGPRSSIGVTNDSSFFTRNRGDGQYNNRSSFPARGPADFRPKEQLDGPACSSLNNEGANQGSLMHGAFKGEGNKGLHSATESDIGGNSRSDLDRSTKPDASDKVQAQPNMEQAREFGLNEMRRPGWKQAYSQNNFGDVDQRSGYNPNSLDKFSNESAISSMEDRSFLSNRSGTLGDKSRLERSTVDASGNSSVVDFKTGYREPLAETTTAKFNNSDMFVKRSTENRQSQMRGSLNKEFCIEKQFNYNHGGNVEKKFVEHVPAKIIDYGHASRSSIQDHLKPAQCFDYGHGNLKPVVPDYKPQPKKDFRHWEESEQNLKEYTEKIKRYEYSIDKKDLRKLTEYNQRREMDWMTESRRCDRERRDKDSHRRRDYNNEDKMFVRASDKDHDDRVKNEWGNNKEKVQERCENSQKEINKGNDEDEHRSKGNVNWQDTSHKNIIEKKAQDTSKSDSQHNALESTPKTLELTKTPNCTMVDDLLCPPGRQNRPPKIAIILRGPPGSGKSFVAKLIKDKEVEQGGSAPRILSLDDYFLVEKEIESKDDNGKKVIIKEMVYEYEEAMEQSYTTSLIKAFKKNITDGFFNFIILDCINEKISDYEEMWSFAKTKGFKVYVCEMEMDLQICLKRNIHNRTEDEINRIIDYFEPTPSYHLKLDVNSMLQEQAIEEVHMEDSQETQEKTTQLNEDSQDSQEDVQDTVGVSKWERMEAENKLDRLDGLAKKKNEGKPQTMEDFLQVPDYYNMEDTSGKKRVRWADLEERKEQEKMRAVGFVVGHTNWDRMMDPTKGGSALTRTKFFSLS